MQTVSLDVVIKHDLYHQKHPQVLGHMKSIKHAICDRAAGYHDKDTKDVITLKMLQCSVLNCYPPVTTHYLLTACTSFIHFFLLNLC